MREILFRGKRKFYGNWIEGMPTYDMNYLFKSETWNSPDNYEIIPETVGQFTGLTDKNGVKIFEGDIVTHTEWSVYFAKEISENLEVFFDDEQLEFSVKASTTLFHCQFHNEFEVIGNIHDNPELLK